MGGELATLSMWESNVNLVRIICDCLIAQHSVTVLRTQLKAHTERVTFVWWEDLTTGRVGWRYSGTEHGELSVTLSGLSMMLVLSVDNYNMLLEVVHILFKNKQCLGGLKHSTFSKIDITETKVHCLLYVGAAFSFI